MKNTDHQKATLDRPARTNCSPKLADFPDCVTNEEARRWMTDMVELCKPDSVYFCDGSQEEYDRLWNDLVEAGTFIRLNEEKRPNSYVAFSDPSDVARVEDRTYICSRDRKSTRLNSSHVAISYAVFCLKKKKNQTGMQIRVHKN